MGSTLPVRQILECGTFDLSPSSRSGQSDLDLQNTTEVTSRGNFACVSQQIPAPGVVRRRQMPEAKCI